MKFCEECGAQMEDEATVCPACGTTVDTDDLFTDTTDDMSDDTVISDSTSVSETTPAIEPTQVDEPKSKYAYMTPEETASSDVPVNNDKSSKKGLIIGLCVGAGSVAVLFVILLLTGVLGGSKSEQEAEAPAVSQAAAETTSESTPTPSPSPSPSPTPVPTPTPTPKPTPKPSYVKSGTFEADLDTIIWTVTVEKISKSEARVQFFIEYHTTEAMARSEYYEPVYVTIKKNKADFYAPIMYHGGEGEGMAGTIQFKKNKVVVSIDEGDGAHFTAKRISSDHSFVEEDESYDESYEDDYDDEYDDYDEDDY